MSSNFNFWGIDGCKGGWFCIGLNAKGHHLSLIAPTIAEAYAELQKHGAKIVLIDIPIGLSDNEKERVCDKEARRFIGPRSSSVFRAPCRQAIEAFSADDEEATKAVNIKITGRSLSKQTLAIMGKIAEVDSFIHDHPSKNIFREVHPEVCFCALNGKTPLLHNKKTKEGIGERLEILRHYSLNTDAIYKESFSKYMDKTVARDDILDALVAALTAKIGYPKKYRTLPANPQKDSQGLNMEMVYVDINNS